MVKGCQPRGQCLEVRKVTSISEARKAKPLLANIPFVSAQEDNLILTEEDKQKWIFPNFEFIFLTTKQGSLFVDITYIYIS